MKLKIFTERGQQHNWNNAERPSSTGSDESVSELSPSPSFGSSDESAASPANKMLLGDETSGNHHQFLPIKPTPVIPNGANSANSPYGFFMMAVDPLLSHQYRNEMVDERSGLLALALAAQALAAQTQSQPTPPSSPLSAFSSCSSHFSRCSSPSNNNNSNIQQQENLRGQPQQIVVTPPSSVTVSPVPSQMLSNCSQTPVISGQQQNQQQTRTKRFQCPRCDKAYYRNSHLQSHIRLHTGERPYVCSFAGCRRVFARSDELARHRRSHTGEKRFQCTACGKLFTRSDHVRKHCTQKHADAEFFPHARLAAIEKLAATSGQTVTLPTTAISARRL